MFTKKQNLSKNEPANEEDVVIEPTEEEVGDGDMRQKIKDLKEKLEICRKERAEYLAGWQRAKADYINLEKEFNPRYADALSFGAEKLFSDIIPVLDSFELAMGNREAWESVPESWRKGVEYISNQLKNALTDNGFAEICPKVGDRVDFEHHLVVEAVGTEEKDKDGVIEKILQKGYAHKNRVVRPARVRAFVYKRAS